MGLTSGKFEVQPWTQYPLISRQRFFDDIELLRQRWQSANTETVAELYAHRPLLSWRHHLHITNQAHRLFQALLSRLYLWPGGGLHPCWAAKEGKQGLVNGSEFGCNLSFSLRSSYQPDPITGRERNRFAIEVDPLALLWFDLLNT